MRLLHTADWHLGRTFHGADLSAAHAQILDHLVDLARSEEPDVVVVAGDVFDRAYPPLPAVELFDETLKRLADLGRPVVITSGNHDSAVRLGVNGRLAETAGIHLRTRLDRIAEPVIVPAGRAGAALLVYAIPYLDPPSTAVGLGASEASHASVLGAALAQIAADRERRSASPAAVIAHGVVTGARAAADDGSGGGVERSIDVGGVAAVPPSLFAGADYAALGHLHRPQTIGDRVRYSGAPLAFGFDEAGDRKSVSLVELVSGGPPQITAIPTPVPRAIARLRGTLDELLSSPAHAEHEVAWVEATLTDRLRPRLAMDQLRQRFPHVLKLEFRPTLADSGDRPPEDYRDRVRGRTEAEVAARFLADVRGGIPADEDETQLLAEALEATSREEALR